jgi:hypothetical protein
MGFLVVRAGSRGLGEIEGAKAMMAALLPQIAALTRQIDQLVYELYGLTDEEIRIVEEATTHD